MNISELNAVNSSATNYETAATEVKRTAQEEAQIIFEMEQEELINTAQLLEVQNNIDNILFAIKDSDERNAQRLFDELCEKLENDQEVANVDKTKVLPVDLIQTRLDEQNEQHIDLRDYIKDNCTDSGILNTLKHWFTGNATNEEHLLQEFFDYYN